MKAIHRLGGVESKVSTAAIAELLGVRAPSVTGMLKRLAEARCIKYEPGEGARLTKSGIARALQVVRRHRLIEVFLVRSLGLDWSEVDAEAEALEHAISPRVERALAVYLGEPFEDPHGHPIPTQDGLLKPRQLEPLYAFRPGQWFVIREVEDDEPERLRHWQALGLTPGARVGILQHQTIDDVYLLMIGDRVATVGRKGLAGVWGEETEPENSKLAG